MQHPLRLSALALCVIACANPSAPDSQEALGQPELLAPDCSDAGCEELLEIATDPGALPQLKTEVNGELKDLPLKHTAVKAKLSGFVAQVEVRQTFENS